MKGFSHGDLESTGEALIDAGHRLVRGIARYRDPAAPRLRWITLMVPSSD